MKNTNNLYEFIYLLLILNPNIICEVCVSMQILEGSKLLMGKNIIGSLTGIVKLGMPNMHNVKFIHELYLLSKVNT